MTPPSESDGREYVVLVDQNDVTDEVRDITLKYDPPNRSGGEGSHVTADGKLPLEDATVTGAHRIEKKISAFR